MLQKAVLLSGNMAGVTVHARARHYFMPVIVFFGHPSFSPHVRYVHTLSVCSLKVHQLPSGHLNSRQNKLRSQWERRGGGMGGQPVPRLPLCLCVLIVLPFKARRVSTEGSAPTAVVLHADLGGTVAVACSSLFSAFALSEEYSRSEFLSRPLTSDALYWSLPSCTLFDVVDPMI